ncbi:MAG: hypothetical protein MI922_24040 [Bacteroidales bacterium]|nr:hypothetical protein [Bacteroidales bacterium]
MIIDIDFFEFLERMLPVHKRTNQPNRVSIYRWSLEQFQNLFNGRRNDYPSWRPFIEPYVEWRANKIFEANITGQTIALEKLLNRKVEGANNQIWIENSKKGGALVAKSNEIPEPPDVTMNKYILFLGKSDSDDFASIHKKGEYQAGFKVDFRVNAPSSADSGQIKTIIEQYRIAGKTYTIYTIN